MNCGCALWEPGNRHAIPGFVSVAFLIFPEKVSFHIHVISCLFFQPIDIPVLFPYIQEAFNTIPGNHLSVPSKENDRVTRDSGHPAAEAVFGKKNMMGKNRKLQLCPFYFSAVKSALAISQL